MICYLCHQPKINNKCGCPKIIDIKTKEEIEKDNRKKIYARVLKRGENE